MNGDKTMEEELKEKVETTEEMITEPNQENPQEAQDLPNSPYPQYSPLYIPEENRRKNNKITVALIIILIFCLICGMIIAVSKLVEAAVNEASAEIPAWKETYTEWKEELADLLASDDTKFDEDKGEFSGPIEDGEEYDGKNPDEYVDDGDSYIPKPEDKYYVELADSICDDLSYSVGKHNYSYFDEKKGVSIWVEYAQIEDGNLAFEDKINEALQDGAMYYAKKFGAEDVSDFALEVSTYVTYMDEEKLSVVVDERYYWETDEKVDLYCMNFDLKTGALLYNTSIIEPTEKLADAFREMSEFQNGYIEALDEMTDKEICEFFSDESTLIVFYTPVGLEVGLNYPNGWITATMKDYEKYLNKL